MQDILFIVIFSILGLAAVNLFLLTFLDVVERVRDYFKNK
jgi:ABC-type antimicrobial peptide transport system permease subunit